MDGEWWGYALVAVLTQVVSLLVWAASKIVPLWSKESRDKRLQRITDIQGVLDLVDDERKELKEELARERKERREEMERERQAREEVDTRCLKVEIQLERFRARVGFLEGMIRSAGQTVPPWNPDEGSASITRPQGGPP